MESVEPNKVIYTVKQACSSEVKEFEIPSGFTLWSTGVKMSPFGECGLQRFTAQWLNPDPLQLSA